MKRVMKWAIALAVSIALAFGTYALAADRRLSGRGPSSRPYLITSAADWATFANDVAAGKSAGKYYALTKNIETNVAVGTEAQPFMGVFDGRNKTITFKHRCFNRRPERGHGAVSIHQRRDNPQPEC